jgi:L-iditol 2-dehydrogenase
MSEMNAVLLTANRVMELGKWPKPEPAKGDVLVKVMHTGVCGSDLHFYEHGRIGQFVVKYPFILGHESAGEVVAMGEGVTSLKIGDRVAMEPGCTCGQCEFCKSGRYNLCPDVQFFAAPPVQGTLCDIVAHPASMCFKLPDNVSTLEGALVEPLAVGFHAARLGQAAPGKTAVVLGSGCIGLVSMLALRAHGVGTVYITDLVEKRLERARELGATEAINIAGCDPVQRVMDLTDGRGVDIVVETSGNSRASFTTVDYVAMGGKIVMVGLSPDPVFEFNFGKIMFKEAAIETVFRYRNCYPAAIAAIAAGLPVGKVVSHKYPFAQAAEAFSYNSAHREDVVKAVIEH